MHGAWGALALLMAGGAVPACYTGVSGLQPQDEVGDAGEAGDDGEADEGGDAGEQPAAQCLEQLPTRQLTRLTPIQVRNTQRDLFGDPGLEITYADEAPIITELGVRQLRGSAEHILSRRDQWTAEVFGCATDGGPDDDCARDFIERFGARVFRRPLAAEDIAWLWAVYETALLDEQLSFADSMDVVLAAMLQAPDHVYVIERGQPVEGGPDDVYALTDHELASRLSYLLWDTMPDDALREAADAGELRTDAGLDAQIDRMLRSDRAEGRLQTFMSRWLHLDGEGLLPSLEETPKDEGLYPEFDPALRDAMRVELEATVRRVLIEEDDATLERLLLDRSAYVNASLADLYGVQGPGDDDTWAWVELPQDERAGLLTRGALLSVHASPRVQSAIHRGAYVIEQVLCSPLPPPPADVDDTPIEDGDSGEAGPKTIRELVEERTAEAECMGCHGKINPTGFLFEHYDAIGRWRDAELTSGLTIDAAAEVDLHDVTGSLTDAVELSHALAQSDTVHSCFAEHWLGEAFGEAVDECTEAEVVDAFVESGDVRMLIGSIVHSYAFRHVRVEGGE